MTHFYFFHIIYILNYTLSRPNRNLLLILLYGILRNTTPHPNLRILFLNEFGKWGGVLCKKSEKNLDFSGFLCYLIGMNKIKRLNEIEIELNNIRLRLAQKPDNNELDVINAIVDSLHQETREITESIMKEDLEKLSDMPR